MIQRADRDPPSSAGRTGRTPRRRPRAPAGETLEVLALFAVALALRVGYAWLAMGPHATPSSDAVSYDAVAWNIARGVGFHLDSAGGHYPTAFVPPVLPFLMSLVYRMAGHQFFAAILLQCVLGALVPLLVRALGGAMFGSPAGRAAGWITCVHPLLVFFSGYVLTETAFCVTLLLAMLASAQWLKTPRPARALGAGLLWGVAALTRPTALPLPLVVVAWSWAPLGLTVTARDRLRQCALLLVGVALVVAPWTARNATQLHAFVPVTTGGGRSLLDANNPLVWNDPAQRGGATSVYGIEPWSSRFRGLGEAEVDRRSGEEAVSFALSHVPQWPVIAAAKLARFWRLNAEAGTTGGWQRPGSPLSPLLRVVDPLLVWSVIVLPLAFWGLWLVWRGARRQYQLLPLYIVLAFTVGAVVYWGSLRLRVPAEPLVALYAGVGLAHVAQRWRWKRSGLSLVEQKHAES